MLIYFLLTISCTDLEKNKFWSDIDEVMEQTPENHNGRQLNGHVWKGRQGMEKVKRGWGFGERNEEGERILEFTDTYDLDSVNTFLKKRDEHIIT